ncbi:hypothetical protein VMCG_10134 [Cytospora schulzeri]|uniref:Uncharacterized protein n=1 Tax=Cytospora schulzeri TaxID=448051 RepID=A0A423VDD4_9PEZI|nr:hypothetical protein VMCG_10134 [Valsa malicola]
MSMAIHEALAILDPTEQTPHDMYAIITYAAAAHPDVAQMMDRFARSNHSRMIGEQHQREAAASTGTEPRLVPIIPAPAPITRKRRTGRPHGSYTRPKEVIEAERVAMEARRAAWKASREARQAQKAAETRKKRESAKNKDFTYLVRRAEEELGWTGKHNNGIKPTWSKAKKKQSWLYKATDVKDSLMWMMNQLLKEMSNSTRLIGTGAVVLEVTYGTKKNALVAMKEIIHAVLVDTSEIGTHLRGKWFSGFEDTLKKAMRLLSQGELATLISDKKWIKDLKALRNIMREQELGDETLKEIFPMVASTVGDGEDLRNEESEESVDEDEGASDDEGGSGDESSVEEDDEDGQKVSEDEDEDGSSEEEISDEASSEID